LQEHAHGDFSFCTQTQKIIMYHVAVQTHVLFDVINAYIEQKKKNKSTMSGVWFEP
jgi:hypothetical protein